jgi:hypothetical protein
MQGSTPQAPQGAPSNPKIRFQSFFMLITIQPSFFASSYRSWVKVPTLVSGSPYAYSRLASSRSFQHLAVAGRVAKCGEGPAPDHEVNALRFARVIVVKEELRFLGQDRLAVLVVCRRPAPPDEPPSEVKEGEGREQGGEAMTTSWVLRFDRSGFLRGTSGFADHVEYEARVGEHGDVAASEKTPSILTAGS